MINLKNYKSTPYHYWKRERNVIKDRNEFSAIAAFCITVGKKYEVSHNNSIRKVGPILVNGWFVNNTNSKNSFEIGCIIDGQVYDFIYILREREKIPGEPTGRDALRRFTQHMHTIAAVYSTKSNEFVATIKEQINKPYIKLANVFYGTWADRELTYVHHIDRHSAYPASLCEAHPEFYDYFNELYEGRQDNPEYKCYLNYCIGAMQSLKLNCTRYPELARDAINGNNKWMDMMTERLKKQGFMVIAYNTDGIFYADFKKPNRLYHDELEGDGMGQWRHDHHFEKIRFKSAGAYEYIENGIYHAVVRGIPKTLSDTFVWGDIYKHNPKRYCWKADFSGIAEVDMTEEEIEYMLIWEAINGEKED